MSKLIVKEVCVVGGVLILKDFKNYKVEFCFVLKSKLDDMMLFSIFLLIVGLVLVLILNILKGKWLICIKLLEKLYVFVKFKLGG